MTTTSSVDLESITQKIAKLLRLSSSSNVHEAASAAAKAQDLMNRYGITQAAAELDAEQGGRSIPQEEIRNYAKVPEASLDRSGRLERWKTSLAMGIAKANQCGVYLSRKYGNNNMPNGRETFLEIYGRPSSVETVRYLYAYLTKEIEQISVREGRGCGHTWANNFRLGAVEVVSQRLLDQRQATINSMRTETASNGAALIRLDQAVVRVKEQENQLAQFAKTLANTLGLKNGTNVATPYNGSAREAGRVAGANISLGGASRGLGSGAKQLA